MWKIALFILSICAICQCQLVEFYSLGGRRADPCVNEQQLNANALRYDCSDNTKLPYPSTTYLIPSDSSPSGRTLTTRTVTIVGRNFPNQLTSVRLSGPGTETCQNTDGATSPVDVSVPDASRTTFTFTIPADWTSHERMIETRPRLLCWNSVQNSVGNYQWTGLRIGVVWNCDDKSDNENNHCDKKSVTAEDYPDVLLRLVEDARRTCCSGTAQGADNRPGQCINPNVESCCGATAISNNMRCCSSTPETSTWADGICPCLRSSSSTDCPSNYTCCLPDKYSELHTTDRPVNFDSDVGECYDPKFFRCCDTGKRYDPGSEQCCSINGLQSVNVPCPCSVDSDCLGGQSGLKNIDYKCCQQSAPVIFETYTNPTKTCTKYNNYPSGQAEYNTQRCNGTCIDTRYQICCNGVACNLEYDACCNSTCCNQFTGTCKTGRRSGAINNPHNWHHFDEPFDYCSSIEQLNEVNVFWVFLMPTAMLIAVIFSLAVSLVFANRVEHRARRGLEKMILIAALVSIITVIPTFFSPVYKYGIVIIFTCLFTIVAVAARKISVYVVSLFVLVVVIFYAWDPFHGNDYLNLSSDRVLTGRPDPASAGLLHSLQKMHSQPESCANFYDYFRLDPMDRDIGRYDNPNISTFGFCSRGFITYLLYACGVSMISLLVQFALVVIALLVRGGYLKQQAEAAYTAAYQSAFGHH